MKIVFLSTWNAHCGIAEYSANLLEEYKKLGHETHVLGNPYYFEVHWWGEGSNLYRNRILDTLEVIKPDVFHVQYQGSLYNADEFNHMIRYIYDFRLADKLVLTAHDSSRGKHDLGYFSDLVYHKKGILSDKELAESKTHLLPFPIQNKPARVFSFGMGRNDYDLIGRICEELGIEYDFHDGRKHGWIEEDELFKRMRNADAIVLWYNEVSGIIGASAAARTALASHRPVITNNVSWFNDLYGTVYSVVSTESNLKAELDEVLHLKYISQNSFKQVAKYHVSTIYGG